MKGLSNLKGTRTELMDLLSCAYHIIGDRCLEPISEPQSTNQDVENVLELMREILIHG